MFLKSQKAFLLALEPLRQISADLSKEIIKEVYVGCGLTIELNRDLASKSRLTSNHDLAENRDLIYFWSNYTDSIAICHCLNLSIMRKTLTGDIGRCHCIVCQLQNWLLFSQILQKRFFVQANFILFFPSFLCLIFSVS